jgi:hypothetical protein
VLAFFMGAKSADRHRQWCLGINFKYIHNYILFIYISDTFTVTFI